MASIPPPAFVTWDMIPAVWLLSPEQESKWLSEIAHLAPGETAQTLERHVCIELPDCPPAWEYQQAYIAASTTRSDLVTPMITSREQWESRPEQLLDVIWRLLHGLPPMVAVCVIAGRRPPRP